MTQNLAETSELWTFNKVLSLGASCPMSANIKRIYGRKTMSPFDWWFVPLTGLISVLLDNDPNSITDIRLLTNSMIWNKMEVFNQKYRIHFNHHFDQIIDGAKVFQSNWREGPLVNFSEHVKRVWEYFTSLNDKENNILFFRLIHPLDNLAPNNNNGIGTKTCFEDIILLESILKGMFAQSTVRLVMVDYRDIQKEFEGVTDPELKSKLQDIKFISPRHDHSPDWMGPPDRWGAALNSLPYRMGPD